VVLSGFSAGRRAKRLNGWQKYANMVALNSQASFDVVRQMAFSLQIRGKF
jgi:hypothetical protein